ncbi:hypothetical protein [Sansalvadorimonas verongulae]|nr:hypothetical protein [Sansalvadorimonas verongulae]
MYQATDKQLTIAACRFHY